MLSETMTAFTTGCEVEITLTHLTADVLRIHYSVRNTSTLPLYLFNQLYKVPYRHPDTQTLVYKVDPNLVNVQLDAAHVKVSKAVATLPDWVFVEALHTPCLSRVLPNETFKEIIELSLPLMPYTIYEPSPATGLAITRPLLFELGYILASPYTETFITAVETPTSPAFYIEAFPAQEQSLISVSPFKNPVTVIAAT